MVEVEVVRCVLFLFLLSFLMLVAVSLQHPYENGAV